MNRALVPATAIMVLIGSVPSVGGEASVWRSLIVLSGALVMIPATQMVRELAAGHLGQALAVGLAAAAGLAAVSRWSVADAQMFTGLLQVSHVGLTASIVLWLLGAVTGLLTLTVSQRRQQPRRSPIERLPAPRHHHRLSGPHSRLQRRFKEV